MKQSKTKVSIIVPCYNEVNTIQLLLKAILEQDFPTEEMEVVIADAQSEDGTRDRIEEFKKQNPQLVVRVVDNPKRTIPAAVNLAVNAAVGEFIVRLDAHSMPHQNYVSTCIQDLIDGKGTNVGGVWKIKPGADTWIAKVIAAAAANPLAVGGARYRYSNKAGVVDTVPFGSFRRQMFLDIGGFDETLLANEDYEFNVRVQESGGKIWFNPQIQCVYFARKNLRALAKQYWRYGFWKYQMLKRYPDTIKMRQALPPILVVGNILGVIASFINPVLMKIYLSLLAFYVLILFIAALYSGWKKKDFGIMVGVPAAVTTMHFSWGAGFIYSFLTKK